MRFKTKIRVLIVDDSRLYREFLVRGLANDPDIEVVATATDPFDARDKIIEYRPDVMTLDVEMPRMNGIEFLRRLMPQYPLPVVVISAVNDSVFDAMNAGAVDFVAKPDPKQGSSLEAAMYELKAKIKIASMANLDHWQKSQPAVRAVSKQSDTAGGQKIIAIGASTGGTEALYSILKALPPTLPGIVVVQHMPPVFTRMFAERMDASTLLTVKEAKTGDMVAPGQVLIAPGDRHMRLKRTGSRYMVECFCGAKVSGHCPSVDVLFTSAAETAGSQAVGVILTGMGQDGAKGLLAMRRSGARTLGQDEPSSVVYGMPKAAWQLGAVEKQAALSAIPQLLYSLVES